MGNCVSEIGLVHFIVNVNDKKDLIESLGDCISMDCDLSENEDYFQDDTLGLGYENEVGRIVAEALADKKVNLKTLKGVTKLFEDVTSAITDQEYFGGCQLSVEEIVMKDCYSVAFAYGGGYN